MPLLARKRTDCGICGAQSVCGAINAKPDPVLRRIQQAWKQLRNLKKVLNLGLTRDGDGHMFRAITRQVVKQAFCGDAPKI